MRRKGIPSRFLRKSFISLMWSALKAYMVDASIPAFLPAIFLTSKYISTADIVDEIAMQVFMANVLFPFIKTVANANIRKARGGSPYFSFQLVIRLSTWIK